MNGIFQNMDRHIYFSHILSIPLLFLFCKYNFLIFYIIITKCMNYIEMHSILVGKWHSVKRTRLSPWSFWPAFLGTLVLWTLNIWSTSLSLNSVKYTRIWHRNVQRMENELFIPFNAFPRSSIKIHLHVWYTSIYWF